VSYFEQTGDGAVHTSVEICSSGTKNFYSPRVEQGVLAEIQERGKLNDGKFWVCKGLFLQTIAGCTR